MTSRKKIFISDIDSALSYHLIEQLRDDFQKLEDYTQLIGLKTPQEIKNQHESITKIFNLETQRIYFYRYLLQCEVFIVWMHNNDPEMENILKLAEERGKSNLPTKIIIISSYMVWARTKPKFSCPQKIEKDEVLNILQSSMNFQNQKDNFYNDNEVRQRKPMITHQHQYQIEEWYENITAKIICSGLIYGKDFPEKWLHKLISKAYQKQNYQCFGSGNNFIPTVHIDDLIRMTSNALTSDKANNYYIAVDQIPCRQIQLLTALKKITGNIRSIQYKQLNFFDETQIMMSQNIVLRKSQERQASASKSCIQYLSDHFQQVNGFLNIEYIHLIVDQELLGDYHEILKVLSENYKFVQINNQIFQEIGEKQDEKVSEEVILQKYFDQQIEPLKYSHFIILDKKKVTLKPQIYSKYSIKKIVADQTTDTQIQLLGQQLWKLLNIINPIVIETTDNQLENKQEKQGSLENDANQQNVSKEESQKCREQNKEDQEIDEVKEEDQNLQINEQYCQSKSGKIDQYLIDNVLLYVSEAYAKINRKPTLENFIKQLNCIYDREIKQMMDD